MDLTYNDYLQRIKMQELLLDAGYVLNKRDGLRWPVYVMLDSTGRRVSGDKFIVNPRTNTCCQPPALRSYNIISFIKCHPYLFKENSSDINPDRLVNLVCHRLLNVPEDIRKERRIDYSKATKPFDIDDYKITSIDGKDFDTMKPFYPYFKSRGINRWTQLAFHHDFCLAEKRSLDGYAVFRNLSFPLRVPGTDKICGFEERGKPRLDGSSGYKGKASGSDGSRGLWLANLSGKSLENAKNVYWFESAYDAMAFYQRYAKDSSIRKGIFISTGGNPTIKQFDGVLDCCPEAVHHLCFDVDEAGNAFVESFKDEVKRRSGLQDEVPSEIAEYIGFAKDIAASEESSCSLHELIYNPSPDMAAKLPESALAKYKAYMELNENLLVSGGSSKNPSQIKEEAKESYDAFRKEINNILGVQQDIQDVAVKRESPMEGYKDWNDELLGEEKKEAPLHQSRDSGIDIDGDGITEMVEEDLPVDEKKQHYKTR